MLVLAAMILSGTCGAAAEFKNGMAFALGNVPKELVFERRAGEPVRFSLEENPSTGFKWEVESNTNECEVALERRGRGGKTTCGAPGNLDVTVTSRIYTPARVEFRYRRPWEKDADPWKTMRLIVYTVLADTYVLTPTGRVAIVDKAASPEDGEAPPGMDADYVAREGAVCKVLWWLKATQQEDGSWNDGPCPVAATALGICAFLAHGEFPYSPSPYAKDFTGTVIAASEYVMGCVSETNGVLRIRGGEDDERSLPIVTMALCELYGMTRNPDAKENAVLCLRHLVGRARSGLESGEWQKKDELLLWTAEALWAGKANMKLERHFGKEGKNRLDELCANLFELTSGLNDNGYCGGRRRYWAWMSADATKKDGEEYFNWRRGKEAAFVKALKEDQEKITDTKGILHSKGFLSESIDAKPSGLGVSADSALSVMELMIGGGGMRNLPIIEESSDNAQPTNDDVSVSVEI
ncbi:MAG: protease inhibitor I42 family protein [Kiritimatiellae bacterium]|nr:protease inhibitor I42 family protein [Kiritimatiellia bacterium]